MKTILQTIRNFKEWLFRLRNPIIFNLEEEYSDLISKSEEIEKRNVLIGTVRRREQLSQNLKHNFYHIPLDELISENGIEYVALYQSINLFANSDEDTGIGYYAKVRDCTRVKRSEISEIPETYNSDRIYVKFNFDKWDKLPRRIYIKEKSPKVFHKTSMYLFSNARYTYELYFESAHEYVIYQGIKDLIDDTYDGFIFKNLKARKIGKSLVFEKSGRKIKMSIKDFKSAPMSSIFKIKRM